MGLVLKSHGLWCAKLDDSDDSDSEEVEINEEAVKKVDDIICSDDDDDDDGLSSKELELYFKQVNESDGFDVDYLYPGDHYGLIHPIRVFPLTGITKTMAELAKMAIDKYNKDEDAHFEFQKLIKGNVQGVAGFMHYITFEAKNPRDSSTTVFQAKAFDGINYVRGVEFCRLKSPNNSPINSSNSSN